MWVLGLKGLRVSLHLHGWDASLTQDTQHKATRSITTPAWMGC